MADPKELSASKIAFYRGCPQACRFMYIGIDGKRILAPKPAPAVFGADIHYLADLLYKKKKKGEIVHGVPKWESVDSCIGTWKYRWFNVMKTQQSRNLPVVFKSDMEKWNYYWTGVRILKGFYNKMVTLPWPAETESTYRGEVAGQKVMARIDRLDIREEENELRHIITDYKTDRSSPEKNTFSLHRSPQFTLQSYLFEKKTGIRPHMILHHMRSGKGFKTRRNDGDYEYLEAIVKDVSEGFKNDRFVPFFGFHCNMCQYREYPCREYSMGVDGKLKALEEAMKTSPEIADWISYDVEKPQAELFENILEKIPKSIEWIKSALEGIFSDYLMMKDTIEEIGLDSLDFISAMNTHPDEDDLADPDYYKEEEKSHK